MSKKSADLSSNIFNFFTEFEGRDVCISIPGLAQHYYRCRRECKALPGIEMLTPLELHQLGFSHLVMICLGLNLKAGV
jgi:hypothetical protein